MEVSSDFDAEFVLIEDGIEDRRGMGYSVYVCYVHEFIYMYMCVRGRWWWRR